MTNLLKISFKMFIRDGKSKIIMIIMGIVFFLGTILSFYQKGAEEMFNHYSLERYMNRTIVVGKMNETVEKQKEELKQIKYVESAFNLYDLMSNRFFSEELKTNNTNGLIIAYTSNNNTVPDIVSGSNFPNNDDGFYMVCPESLYAQVNLSSAEVINKITNKDKINMNKYIDKTINFSYSAYDEFGKSINKSIDVKIVGTYKVNEHIIEDNICYMNENLKKEVYYNMYVDMDNSLYELDEESLFIVLDNYSNYEYVINELEKLGYSYDLFYEIDKGFLINLKYSLNCFCTITVVISLCLVVLLFSFCLYKNIKNYKLFEYLGYSISDIRMINLLYNMFVSISSFIFAIVLSFLYQYVMRIIIYCRPFIFKKYEIIFSIDYMLIVSIVSLAFVFIASVISNRFIKMIMD